MAKRAISILIGICFGALLQASIFNCEMVTIEAIILGFTILTVGIITWSFEMRESNRNLGNDKLESSII